jgi:hypothetical protein
MRMAASRRDTRRLALRVRAAGLTPFVRHCSFATSGRLDGAFADGGRDPLRRPVADIAGGEYRGDAGLERKWRAAEPVRMPTNPGASGRCSPGRAGDDRMARVRADKLIVDHTGIAVSSLALMVISGTPASARETGQLVFASPL